MKRFDELSAGRKALRILLCIVGAIVAVEAFVFFLFWVMLGGEPIL